MSTHRALVELAFGPAFPNHMRPQSAEGDPHDEHSAAWPVRDTDRMGRGLKVDLRLDPRHLLAEFAT